MSTPTTPTTTLTDRYVFAVVRSLPEGKQRADIERELRASIADQIDARVDAGERPEDAERSTLTELGDPMRLAGEYADRPAWLIGPKYLYTWWRLLKLLWAIVLPIVFVVLWVTTFIGTQNLGGAFGSAFSVALTVGVHLGFWVTLAFAIIERSGNRHAVDSWSLHDLPQLPEPHPGRHGRLGELIPAVVFLLFFAGAIVWQQLFSVFADPAGNPIPLVNPQLWSFWLPYALVIIAAELAFAVVLFVNRRWTWPLAGVHAVLSLAFAIPGILLLLRGELLNPEYFAQFGWTQTLTTLVIPIAAAAIAIITLLDIVDGFVKAYRATRAPASIGR